MTIIINTTNLRSGGGLQVALSLLRELRGYEEHSFAVLLSPQMAPLVDQKQFSARFSFHRFDANPASSPAALYTFRKRAAAIEREKKVDAVLTVFGPALWRPKAPHLVGFANCIYLFDDSYFIENVWPSGFFQKLKYRSRRKVLLQQLRKESDGLWVETEHARAKLASIEGFQKKQITVVPNTYGDQFAEPSVATSDNAASRPNATFRLLTVSAAHPNKNLELIRKLLPLLQGKGVGFTVTLPDEAFRQIFGPLADHPMLTNVGTVHPLNLPVLYAQADAAFLPSLLEVFSASYPEAMKMGLPIITTDLPFARETCGDAALYFDPASPESAASAILQLKNDGAMQSNLVAKGKERVLGFSSARERAASLLNLLEGMASGTSAQSTLS